MNPRWASTEDGLGPRRKRSVAARPRLFLSIPTRIGKPRCGEEEPTPSGAKYGSRSERKNKVWIIFDPKEDRIETDKRQQKKERGERCKTRAKGATTEPFDGGAFTLEVLAQPAKGTEMAPSNCPRLKG